MKSGNVTLQEHLLLAAATKTLRVLGHTPRPWRYEISPNPGWVSICSACEQDAVLGICTAPGYPTRYYAMVLPHGTCTARAWTAYDAEKAAIDSPELVVYQ